MFDYDGKDLIRKISTSPNARAGDVAGNADGNGYIKISIAHTLYYAHRLIWLYVYGEWPNSIDHINRNKHDNRISNLRNVSHSTNLKNQKLRSTSSSGVHGVHWYKAGNKWHSEIKVNYKKICLGYSDSLLDAVCIRKSAEIEHGFHPSHGREKFSALIK